MEKGEITPTSKVPKYCGFDVSNCESGSYVGIIKTYVTDRYVFFNNDFAYKTTSPDFNRLEYVWVPTGRIGPRPGENFHEHRDAPAPHGPGGTGHPSNHPVEIIKDPTFIGSRPDCLFDKLVSTNGDLFRKTIGKFKKDPKYDLILMVGNCPKSNVACTDGKNVDISGDITITIEDITQSSMSLAATILHEGIHAELFRYVSRYKKGIDSDDKKEVFNYYKYYAERYGDVFHDDPSQNGGEIDHIYMTQHYIVPIATALRELDNNHYPLDYYKSFAWDGLRDWDPNNTLKMEDSKKYDNYRVIVDANFKSCKN